MDIKLDFGSYPRLITYKDKLFLCGGNCFAFGSKEFEFDSPTYFARDNKAIDGSDLNTVDNAQPFVLSDGKIIIFYRANSCSISGSGYSSIRMIISDTNGQNFSQPIKIFENYDNHFEHKGIWEPFPLLIEEDNNHYKLLVYLSVDIYQSNPNFNGYHLPDNKEICNKVNGGQNIIYIPININKNDINIGKPVLVFESYKQVELNGLTNPIARPGMTVISKLSDGSYIMVLESSVENPHLDCHMVIQYSYSKDGYQWSNPKTLFTPLNKGFFKFENVIGNQKYVKAAPYVVTLPDGRIAISLQSNDSFDCGFYCGDATGKRIEVYLSKDSISYGDNLISSSFDKVQHHSYTRNEFGCWASLFTIDNSLFVLSGNGINEMVNEKRIIKHNGIIISLVK